MSYAEDETDVEGTVNGVTATTTGTKTLSGKHLQIWPIWGVCVCFFLTSASLQTWFRIKPHCCSIGLCPGGGSTGRPPEAGESVHDGKEGELKQEEGFFSKLKNLFSSSWQPHTR